MVTYEIGGTTIQGGTPEEMVREMAQGKLTTPRSINSYRRAVARRYRDTFGAIIRTNTNEVFIEDMKAAGFITEVQ